MNKRNKKKFKKTHDLLKKEKNAVDETLELKRKSVRKEMEDIRQFEKMSNRYGFACDACSDITDEKLNEMDDETYVKLFFPSMNDLAQSGKPILAIHNHTQAHFDTINKQNYVIDSTQSTGGSAVSAIQFFVGEYPELFPNKDKIIQKYNIEYQLESEIEDTRKKLKDIDKDVYDDFEYFINKYFAFKKDKSQYQDLIGIRSTFFFKLIFEFTKKKFGIVKKRKEAIKRFIFGNSSFDSMVLPTIDIAYDLWKELSSQSNSGYSVKLGTITPDYVENIFRRIIGVMAAVLKLREGYYSE